MAKRKTIGHNRPCVGKEEIADLGRVIESGWLIAGARVAELENKMAGLVGVEYAVALNSGLSGLHLALLALGVGRGDEVIVPAYTCVALLHAVAYVRAIPMVVDIETENLGMDPGLVKKTVGQKTKAVIVPHMLGLAARVEEIAGIGIPVIEDCAQSLGTKAEGEMTGASGRVGVFSFYATKMIGAGQGGMVVTNEARLTRRMEELVTVAQKGKYRVGYNYRMTDVTAAIALAQLKRIKSLMSRRRTIARAYDKVVLGCDQVNKYPRDVADGNCFRYVIKFGSRRERDGVRAGLRTLGVESIPPVSDWELLSRQLGLPRSRFPVAEEMAATCLSVPIYPCLSDEQVERVVDGLAKILEKL